MIARYMGCEYTYISNGRSKEIITSQKEKVKEGFTSGNGIYYKVIDESDLTDIYSVEFWVKYNTGFDCVSDWWILGNEQNVITDNKVQLVFAECILPNWNIVEKNVCSILVPMEEILEAKMVISYKKRAGIALEERISEERILSGEELKQLHGGYCRVNI
jgi:hypothetical protein